MADRCFEVLACTFYCSLFVDIVLHFSGRLRGVQILVGFTVLLYTHASVLCAMLITGECSFWIWFSYTFLLPLYITDTTKTGPSSQEASESSLGLQQAKVVLVHKEEGILPEHVAVCVKLNKGKPLNVCCELCMCHMTFMASSSVS